MYNNVINPREINMSKGSKVKKLPFRDLKEKVVKEKVEKEPPLNLKEKNAIHTFRVNIRDREHFYKITDWLNKNVGRGNENWTMEGRVLKALKDGRSPNPKIYIFRQDFDPTSSLYLTLL